LVTQSGRRYFFGLGGLRFFVVPVEPPPPVTGPPGLGSGRSGSRAAAVEAMEAIKPAVTTPAIAPLAASSKPRLVLG
jgi:hypothetical protein